MYERPLVLGLDATPLLGRPTGVARYVQGLITGLELLDNAPEVVLTAFSLRGDRPPGLGDPSRVRWAKHRLPARILQSAWSLAPTPPVELLSGPVDVFHATNFVLPPRRRAGGVVTVHDLTYLRYPGTVTPQVLKYVELVPRSIDAAAVVISVSNVVAEELRATYSLEPERVIVAPNGVDDDWFSAPRATRAELARLGIPERYLLFVGSVEPRKNLSVLVTAHEQARHSDPNTPPLVIAGPGGWGAPLQHDSRHVVRAGFLSDRDLRAVVASATALAVPSLYEGFGLPALEAMACGTPVIASTAAALAEVVGSAGTLVPAEDVDGWAQAIVEASFPPSPERVAMARERARQFTWQNSAEIHLRAYRLAADRGRF